MKTVVSGSRPWIKQPWVIHHAFNRTSLCTKRYIAYIFIYSALVVFSIARMDVANVHFCMFWLDLGTKTTWLGKTSRLLSESTCPSSLTDYISAKTQCLELQGHHASHVNMNWDFIHASIFCTSTSTCFCSCLRSYTGCKADHLTNRNT